MENDVMAALVELLVDRKERGIFEPAGSIVSVPSDIADRLISRRIAKPVNQASGGSTLDQPPGSTAGSASAVRFSPVVESASRDPRATTNQAIKRKPQPRG